MWKLILLFFLGLLFFPDSEYLFGFDTTHKNYNLKLPESFTGPLIANNWLSYADHIYDNEIQGPESFAMWKGKVYTSLADGRIIELSSNNFRTAAFLNLNDVTVEDCQNSLISSKYCARPLGLRFSSNGSLYAVDPYHGIFQINVTNGEYRLIMNIKKHKLPDRTEARFLDDLVLLEDDDGNMIIYITDASRRWRLHDVFYVVGEHDQTGRLLSFNTRTNQLKVEIEKLSFPNGLELTNNKSVILLNEFNKRRILAYHIKGERKNTFSVFIDGLPGEPDNIKRSLNPHHETYWVALFTGRNVKNPSWSLDGYIDKSYQKRFLFRLIRMIGFIIETVGFIIQCESISQVGFDIRVANFLIMPMAEYGLAIEIDSNGNIINSLHSPDGLTTALSEIYEYKNTEHERYFYLGSYINTYLGRVVVEKRKLQYDMSQENGKIEEKMITKTYSSSFEPIFETATLHWEL